LNKHALKAPKCGLGYTLIYSNIANVSMTTPKLIIILTLTILLSACRLGPENKYFEHNYTKYWNKYTEQQLIDSLYSDTVKFGPEADGSYTTKLFYINQSKELIADLQDDKNNMDSLFPMTAFNKLTIKKLPLGFKKIFTNKQTAIFLQIINDPVSFEWTDTSYVSDYRVDFLKNNKVVATITLGADKLIIKTKPNRPDYKKMKFRRLKAQQYNDLTVLLNNVGN